MKGRTFAGVTISVMLGCAATQAALGAYRAHPNDQDANRFLGTSYGSFTGG